MATRTQGPLRPMVEHLCPALPRDATPSTGMRIVRALKFNSLPCRVAFLVEQEVRSKTIRSMYLFDRAHHVCHEGPPANHSKPSQPTHPNRGQRGGAAGHS